MAFNCNIIITLIETQRRQDFNILLGIISEYKMWIIFKMVIKKENSHKKMEHICVIIHNISLCSISIISYPK